MRASALRQPASPRGVPCTETTIRAELRRTRRAQALKFHDLAHAAHWHMPVHAHQLTQLHCDMDEGPSLEDIFHMADFDGSGTLSVDGLAMMATPRGQHGRRLATCGQCAGALR